MSTYPALEIEQDAYGSVVIPLSDEICHDLALQPSERFDIEIEGDTITLKRVHAGYDIDQ
tara:strand:- start:1520 stop:1699 length:180 start_codon:yes stop_codon:yes gene_type:complete